MPDPTDNLVLMSGGVDSASCAHYFLRRGQDVRLLFVEYGQKAAKPERAAAEKISSLLGLKLNTTVLSHEPSIGAGEIAGRNAFLVFAAMLRGFCNGGGTVVLGIHSGTPYYDCSPAFLNSVDRLVAEYTDGRRRVIAPFLNWDKQEIYNYYRESGLPLDVPYSCESGEIPPCGACSSCLDRGMLG